jgi:prohibitin 1
LSFGQDFTAAVEQKVIAQQEAERAKFVVEKAEQEKMAGIIRAEGESAAASLLSSAYAKSGQAHLELRRIQAAKEIASTLANSKNVTYLPGGGSNNGSGNYLLKVD